MTRPGRFRVAKESGHRACVAGVGVKRQRPVSRAGETSARSRQTRSAGATSISGVTPTSLPCAESEHRGDAGGRTSEPAVEHRTVEPAHRRTQGPADSVSDRLGDRPGRTRLGHRAYDRNVANAGARPGCPRQSTRACFRTSAESRFAKVVNSAVTAAPRGGRSEIHDRIRGSHRWPQPRAEPR
jgi:hypothetical protein